MKSKNILSVIPMLASSVNDKEPKAPNQQIKASYIEKGQDTGLIEVRVLQPKQSFMKDV